MPDEVVELVRVLTKKPGEDYLDYILRVKTHSHAAWQIKAYSPRPTS